jgi:heme/copper-type cytochrome/quinol oxidase subunit 1
MQKARLSICFLIEVLFILYGAMILGSGIYERVTASYPSAMRLTQLHVSVCWGATLLALGIVSVVKISAPARAELDAAAGRQNI